MPAHPKPLTPKPPAERPPGIPDENWYFPRNLADYANANGLFQADVARIAQVSLSTVSRWMNYGEGSLLDLRLTEIIALENEMRLPRGTLTQPPAAVKRVV